MELERGPTVVDASGETIATFSTYGDTLIPGERVQVIATVKPRRSPEPDRTMDTTVGGCDFCYGTGLDVAIAPRGMMGVHMKICAACAGEAVEALEERAHDEKKRKR